MKKSHLQLVIAGLIALAQPILSQNVKLAKIALGMDEPEVKAALAANSPIYIEQPSASPDLYYLVAGAETESFAFTMIDGKVAAFSVTHLLPPGQQPFLPAGQQPTVAILRGLITKQTWTPAEINKGDTFWFSDATGAPLSNASQCAPEPGEAWLAFGPISHREPGEPSSPSTVGLMKPALVPYPPKCGVTIHLNESPAETEETVVTSVQYQVLDIKAMNAFLAKHRQH